MPWVERSNGKVVGRYGCVQPGRAEEWLEEEHIDLLPTPEELATKERQVQQQKALEALPDILAYIAAKADAPVAVKGKAAELVAVKVVK